MRKTTVGGYKIVPAPKNKKRIEAILSEPSNFTSGGCRTKHKKTVPSQTEKEKKV